MLYSITYSDTLIIFDVVVYIMYRYCTTSVQYLFIYYVGYSMQSIIQHENVILN